MEGGLGRRPYCVLWEARQSGRPNNKIDVKIPGGPTMREAGLYTLGKPDNAGSPQPGSTSTWKLASAGGLIVSIWEARLRGDTVTNTL